MHPPLHRPHPDCQDIITKLIACHEENKVSKFFGVCNDVKAELVFQNGERCCKERELKKS